MSLPQGDVDSSRHLAIPSSVKACAVELSSTYPLQIELLCRQLPLDCYQPTGFDRCQLASYSEGDLSSHPFHQTEYDSTLKVILFSPASPGSLKFYEWNLAAGRVMEGLKEVDASSQLNQGSVNLNCSRIDP